MQALFRATTTDKSHDCKTDRDYGAEHDNRRNHNLEFADRVCVDSNDQVWNLAEFTSLNLTRTQYPELEPNTFPSP